MGFWHVDFHIALDTYKITRLQSHLSLANIYLRALDTYKITRLQSEQQPLLDGELALDTYKITRLQSTRTEFFT